MTEKLYRTYDAYGNETTHIDVRNALFRQDQAKAAASVSPVLAALAEVSRVQALIPADLPHGYNTSAVVGEQIALRKLADAVRAETPEQFNARMEWGRHQDNAELHRRNLAQDTP